MAKKKAAAKPAPVPKSFGGLIRGYSAEVRQIAKALQTVVFEELADAEERFYGGQRPMAMYRTSGDICWIQPLKSRCNLYFMQGPNLTDRRGLLEGSSDRLRHVKVNSPQAVDQLPIREWLRESIELHEAATAGGMSIDDCLERLRKICLALPHTKETLTWGKPHFRVAEKIFCSCGEDKGEPRLGIKAEPREATMLMRLPGIEKAAYSRPNDGWISINPNKFDDWEEIERLAGESYRLVAPKQILNELD